MRSLIDPNQRRLFDDPEAVKDVLHKRFKRALDKPAIKDAKRRVEAVEAGRDALVFFFMATVVNFASSWGQVAATLKWTPAESCYIVAGGFLVLSFLSGLLYVKCRGWRDMLAVFFTVITTFLRSTVEAIKAVEEFTGEELPKRKELEEMSGSIAKVADDDQLFSFNVVDGCFRAQWIFLLCSVAFYLFWLAQRTH